MTATAAAPMTATAATFAATLPPTNAAFRPATRLLQSSARAMRRFFTGGCSSPLASERRARKMRVSTAACDTSSSAAISRYESPCHSRRRIARRWVSGSCSRTSWSPISSSPRRAGAGASSSIHLEVGRRLDAAPPPRRAASRETDVVGDLEEPGRLELGHDAALDPTEGVQERALNGVLGLLARAELVQAEAEDLIRVPLVERARRVRLGGKWPLDAARTTYGRNCGQMSLPGGRRGKLRPSTPRSNTIGEVSGPGNHPKGIFGVTLRRSCRGLVAAVRAAAAASAVVAAPAAAAPVTGLPVDRLHPQLASGRSARDWARNGTRLVAAVAVTCRPGRVSPRRISRRAVPRGA